MYSLWWVQFILVLAPLLVVPIALQDVPVVQRSRNTKLRGIVAAGGLLAAHFAGPGILGGLLSLLWLFFAVYILWTLYRQWRTLDNRFTYFWLLRLGALVYLCIGAMWAVADRFGWQPLGFDPIIVLLTAVHFHYAGFALLWIAGKVLGHCRRNWEKHLLSSVILGVPLTAVGITASHWNWSPMIEVGSVMIMAIGGIAVALTHLRLAFSSGISACLSRSLWILAGFSLLIGMVLAVLYGLRYYWPLPWLSIPWMYAVHGSFNSLGFALPALVGWYVFERDQSATLA